MGKYLLRRLIPIVAGAGIVAASASNVVSCVAPQFAAGKDGQRVVVATDGGHVNDKSFNQDAYLGVKNFVKDAYNIPESESKSNYVEAGGTDTTSIVSGYRLAVLKKANAIVMPGFSHVNTLPSALPFLQKHNVNVVLVDGQVTAPNVISILFNSQISGVMAGFDTSYMMGTTFDQGTETIDVPNEGTSESFSQIQGRKLHYDTNGDGKLKIGTFAGASNKYGVDNYMWGLLLGMEIYNQVAIAHNKANPNDVWAAVESGNTTDGKIESVAVKENTDPNYYTNSFALGDATKTGMVDKLVNTNKSDVVFPVAGPQIQDVLGYKQAKPYVIGVDVDQAAAFPSGQGRFITSAIKNIDTAVPEALYRAEKEDGTGNTLKPDKDVDTSNSVYGGWKSDNERWLGQSPEPFVNWSIDFAGKGPAGGNYLLKQHHISLYDEKDVFQHATGAMLDINDHFRDLGTAAKDYMNGNDIYKFAKELIAKYKPNVTITNNDDSTGMLTWFNESSNEGDSHE